jgi:glycosyltransferase involved in cell wall biosynthesis
VDAGEASLESLARARRIPTEHVPDLGRRLDAAGDLRGFLRLVRIVFREKPDVIHTHTAKAGTLGRLAAALFNLTRRRRRRALVVHTFHGHVLSGYFSPAGDVAVRVIERALSRITDAVITISPAQQRDIVETYKVAAAGQTLVVPLGLDLTALFGVQPGAAGMRARLGIEAAAVVVGYIGRFVPIKDLGVLLRSFAAARATAPDLYLLLAGDGPTRPEIERLAGELGIVPRVRFIGWTDALAEFYETLDVCALSSRNEGTPVAIIEAMAAGKPIVATSVGGVPDVIENGRSGILVPAGAIDDMAAALVRLASCPAERQRFGRAGRDEAVRFGVDRLVREMDMLYSDALARKRRA